MNLHGIHHITAITADARANLHFYAGVLGLRFVKKTVNFDDPDAYHLYYGDERGSPGSILTFFEYRGVPRGRAGQGMIHTLTWRVGDERALEFWEERLRRHGVPAEHVAGRLRFEDPEGLGLEMAVAQTQEEPLTAASADVPAPFALQGFDGVRAYTSRPERSAAALRTTLQFDPAGSGSASGPAGWRVRAGGRSSRYIYDEAPARSPLQGAGTVHHIAWAVPDAEQPDWHERLLVDGLRPTPVIDRTYFRSVYFREPSGVLFEIATLGPGFAIDEPLEHLGERLQLPERYEHLRQRLERELTPLENPRAKAAA